MNPPPQARFYPFYSTINIGGHCMWQEGGAHIPGTTNKFDGEVAEYGSLLESFYPESPPGSLSGRYQNFHHTLDGNPCT